MPIDRSALEKWLWLGLCAFAALAPVSITLVQPVVYALSLGAIYYWYNYRPQLNPTFPFRRIIFLFLAIVVIVSILGVRPETSFKKFNRFVVLMIAWLVPVLIASPGLRNRVRLEQLVVLFVLGTALKAAYDMIRVPAMMAMDVPLFMTGNMRDPQIYMVAISLVAGMLMSGAWKLRYPPVTAGLILVISGMIIHFKRGAWAACLGALLVMTITSRKWRPLAVAGLIIAVLCSIPDVRERIGQLKREFDPDGGGRMLLWTQVAPALIPEHPMGMGWKAVKHEDFLAVTEKVEPKLNHLHNNLLQVTLELGWLGLSVWLFWMASVLYIFLRSYKKAVAINPAIAGVALGGLGAFSGLMLNGMVEYNFGDSEIFMLMVIIMGLAAGVHGCMHAGGRVDRA
jgi:O-antigen ligase